MIEHLNKNILCTIADNDAIRETSVMAVSPNGRFTRLGGDRTSQEEIGWVRSVDVKVLDVLPSEAIGKRLIYGPDKTIVGFCYD